MIRRLIIEPEAEADLHDAYTWYDERREGLGDDFLLCVEAQFESIKEHPESFRVIAKKTRRAVLRRFPYVVLFLCKDDSILIVGVFHFKRESETLEEKVEIAPLPLMIYRSGGLHVREREEDSGVSWSV